MAIPQVAKSKTAEKKPGGRDPVVDSQHLTLQHVTGQPFVQGSGDADAVDANDVGQGNLGDCWLMAAMMSVARASPATIKSLIKPRPDGKYDVTLHIAGARTYDAARNCHVAFKTVIVVVDSNFPSAPQDTFGSLLSAAMPAFATPAFARKGDVSMWGFGVPELWPMILERAVAVYRGGYTKLDEGYNIEGLELLTGKSQNIFFLSEMSPGGALAMLAYCVTHRVPVVISSADPQLKSRAEKAKYDSLGIVGPHGYSLAAANVAAGTVDLDNPWGFQHLHGLSITNVLTYFYSFAADVGKPAPAKK